MREAVLNGRSNIAVGCAAVGAALLLSSCAGSSTSGATLSPSASETTSASPSATSSPGATSQSPSPRPTDPKAQAYANATAGYERYRNLLDQVTADGGKDPERLSQVATGFGLQQAETTASLYRDRGWRTVTPAALVYATPKSFTPATKDPARVQIVSCLDTRGARAVDATGSTVPKQGNVTFLLDNVTVVASSNDLSGPWLVEKFTSKRVSSCSR